MALTADYIERLFFGPSGNNYYFRVIRRGDGKIWDNVNFELSDDPTWTDTAIVMTEKGTNGQYPVTFPIANALTQGHTYDVVVYKRATATALNTDVVQAQYEVKVGSVFGF